MCLAVPGKIVEIEEDIAIVDYDLEERKGKLLEKYYSVGDYVILQGGIVVTKVDKKEAQEALKLYKSSLGNN
ncbi:HypC/HybG/HupF family hydrogenase formation chaperone [Candidatus Woesearchaeota archaeon]|nr:HypC/HybG/HupF family hydrogenase formation chaperone [Candidatus Woesearchaeota archaeon]